MNGLPYYPRYPRDFFEGTAGMRFELKAAYGLVIDLIFLMGDRGLPDDPHFISGHLGCSVRKWNALRSELIAVGKLSEQNGVISNTRADNLKIIQRSYQDKQAEKASGPRKNKGLQEPRQSHTNTDTNSSSSAREAEPKHLTDDQLYDAVLSAVGLKDGRIPTYWMPPSAIIHVGRWRKDLGLSEKNIVDVAHESRKHHDEPPNGPKALDGAMKRLAATKEMPMEPGKRGPRQFSQQDSEAAKLERWNRIASGKTGT